MTVSFKGAHFPEEIILTGVRWYVAYPLSTRHVEELMHERGVKVDHFTINRWVITYNSPLEEAFHRFEPGAILQNPAVDGGVVDRHAAFLHHFL